MTRQTLRWLRIVVGLLVVSLFGGAAWGISPAATVLGIAAGVISSTVMEELFDGR